MNPATTIMMNEHQKYLADAKKKRTPAAKKNAPADADAKKTLAAPKKKSAKKSAAK